MARLCGPDQIVWIDGSEEEKERLTQEAAADRGSDPAEPGKAARLPLPSHGRQRRRPDRGPDLHLHHAARRRRTDQQLDVAGGRLPPAKEILAGSMRGRTMYVIPFSMGPVGSPFSKIGVELTDSIYVVLNMRIMTHVGAAVLEAARHRRRVHQVPARQGRPGHQAPADPALPRRQHDLERRLGLRRQRACWARSASRCASPAIWASGKAGWPSTC